MDIKSSACRKAAVRNNTAFTFTYQPRRPAMSEIHNRVFGFTQRAACSKRTDHTSAQHEHIKPSPCSKSNHPPSKKHIYPSHPTKPKKKIYATYPTNSPASAEQPPQLPSLCPCPCPHSLDLLRKVRASKPATKKRSLSRALRRRCRSKRTLTLSCCGGGWAVCCCCCCGMRG
jgi:hypothetical protein